MKIASLVWIFFVAQGFHSTPAMSEPYVAIGRFEEGLPGFVPFKPESVADATALQSLYLAAVADASNAEPGEISRDLEPVVDWNPNIIRRNRSGDWEVLAVTWTSFTGYDGIVGATTTLTREVWVTLAPQVKLYRSGLTIPDASVVLRFEQLLGLPPGNGKTRFVEMWVNPGDLFRPSADPEISDYEAGLDFINSRHITISPEHQNWVNTLRAASYIGPFPYPWTRLGYTYDWGNPQNEVGLSEYVIGVGATVEIEAVALNGEYLAMEGNSLLWVR